MSTNVLKFSQLSKVIDPVNYSAKVFIDSSTILQISAPEFMELSRMALTAFEGKSNIPDAILSVVQTRLKESVGAKKKGRPVKINVSTDVTQEKKRRGRPPKNKTEDHVVLKKKRGRPKGSKNKPKVS